MKNAFTGGELVARKSEIEEHDAAAFELYKKDETEWIHFGEPHPITGEYQRRRATVGRKYDFAPRDGTFTPCQVDQTGADAVDINKIMNRVDPHGKQFAQAVRTGIVTDAGMLYDDFTKAESFQDALNIVIHGRQQFALLDARTRNRFDNDPAKFLAYIDDPANVEEHIALGFRKKPETQAPAESPDSRSKPNSAASKPSPKGKATPASPAASKSDGGADEEA